MAKCPGSDMRDMTAVEVLCPECGTSVEFFSDEARRTCPGCGTKVTRDAVPSCAARCTYGLTCIGPERYKALVESGAIEAVAGRSEDRS